MNRFSQICRSLFLLGAIFLYSTVASSMAYASTISKYTLSSLAQHADVILLAEVIRVHSQRNERFVTTDTSLQVQKVYKGKVGETVVLHQRGGRVGDFATVVPGMPFYTEGEKVLLFLEAKPSGSFVTAALSQGKYDVYREAGKDYVYVAPSFISLKETSSQRIAHDDGSTREDSVTHEDRTSDPVYKMPSGNYPLLLSPQGGSERLKIPLDDFTDLIQNALRSSSAST